MILITGGTGQLGSDIAKELNSRNIKNLPIGSKDLDITDNNAVKAFFEKNKFDAVIHCAAYTKVDKAEEEKELCYKINVCGTKNISEMCKKQNIPLMYFSTDYVFGGEGDKPFKIGDKRNPLGYYAKTKSDAEDYVNSLDKFFIIRISWVFGKNGTNFIKTMIKLSETHNDLRVVYDQVGSPTYTVDLAKLVADMIVTDKYGVYHASNEGFVSWADFARCIFKKIGKDVKVNDVTTEEYGAKAPRPKNSRLDKSELERKGFHKLPPWEDALDRFLIELK